MAEKSSFKGFSCEYLIKKKKSKGLSRKSKHPFNTYNALPHTGFQTLSEKGKKFFYMYLNSQHNAKYKVFSYFQILSENVRVNLLILPT